MHETPNPGEVGHTHVEISDGLFYTTSGRVDDGSMPRPELDEERLSGLLMKLRRAQGSYFVVPEGQSLEQQSS